MPWTSCITNSIGLRFSKPSYKVYEQLESLILKAVQSQNFDDEWKFLCEKHSGDVNSSTLFAQLSLLPILFKNDAKSIACFEDFATRRIKNHLTSHHNLQSAAR